MRIIVWDIKPPAAIYESIGEGLQSQGEVRMVTGGLWVSRQLCVMMQCRCLDWNIRMASVSCLVWHKRLCLLSMKYTEWRADIRDCFWLDSNCMFAERARRGIFTERARRGWICQEIC